MDFHSFLEWLFRWDVHWFWWKSWMTKIHLASLRLEVETRFQRHVKCHWFSVVSAILVSGFVAWNNCSCFQYNSVHCCALLSQNTFPRVTGFPKPVWKILDRDVTRTFYLPHSDHSRATLAPPPWVVRTTFRGVEEEKENCGVLPTARLLRSSGPWEKCELSKTVG